MGQPGDPTQKPGIRSVEKAFDVLAALEAAGRPMRLAEIVAATGMARNLVHAYLVSLQRVGAVIQETDTGRYDLGGTITQMGLSALARSDFLSIARGEMQSLSEMTGQSTWLSVWGERGPVIVAKVEGGYASPFEIRVGSTVDLTVTATGLTYIAHLPRSRWRHLLDQERERFGASVPDDQELDAWLRAIRSRGVASRSAIMVPQQNVMLPQFSALAAPVFDHSDNVKGVLTTIGASEAFDSSVTGADAERLKAAAERLSGRFGHRTRAA